MSGYPPPPPGAYGQPQAPRPAYGQPQAPRPAYGAPPGQAPGGYAQPAAPRGYAQPGAPVAPRQRNCEVGGTASWPGRTVSDALPAQVTATYSLSKSRRRQYAHTVCPP